MPSTLKDVDGVTTLGFSQNAFGFADYPSCTPAAIIAIMDYYCPPPIEAEACGGGRTQSDSGQAGIDDAAQSQRHGNDLPFENEESREIVSRGYCGCGRRRFHFISRTGSAGCRRIGRRLQ